MGPRDPTPVLKEDGSFGGLESTVTVLPGLQIPPGVSRGLPLCPGLFVQE